MPKLYARTHSLRFSNRSAKLNQNWRSIIDSKIGLILG